VGVFPENAVHWDWIAGQVRAAGQPMRVLNLFGYTGLATLAAAEAGAHVTHVDASKKAVLWARDNQELSGLQDRPIRWIVEDALTYLRREARRGVRYDGIVLDPPAFGRGPDGQVWTFDRLFDELCRACRAVLSAAPRFVVATVYTKGITEQALRPAMDGMLAGLGGQVEIGELITVERSAGRVLHNALYARWSHRHSGNGS
jgi:23S rRNA (cytosine1962-C5)-methyltransferase